MDEAIDFIRAYIEKEYEAAVALYGERDEAVFKQKVGEVLRLLDPSERVEVGLTRPGPADKRWFRDSRDALASTAPRPLFLVRHRRRADGADLFEADVGVRFDYPKQGYADALFVARTADGLRVVASNAFCRVCRGASARGGDACKECGSTGWALKSGANVDAPGQLLETRKLTPPTEPTSLADYERS